MDDEQRQHLEDLRRRHQRRLRELERQAATFGASTPPEVAIEIQDIQAKITSIEADLQSYLPASGHSERDLAKRPPLHLPAQMTSLIGRDREVAAACELLQQANVRLVTLTGPGGVGKTRLGLQVASALFDSFPDGVFFVALASIAEPGLVPSAIAQVLGVRETSGQPLTETIKNLLANRHTLLLLDNFEQVVDAAPLVSELLAAAPGLKVLVTSRIVLRLSGEREFFVPPLTIPDPKHLPLLEHLSQYEAVRLFIERAIAVKPNFTVTNDNAPAVAAICARLDGLPLAIELAAVRVKILTPEQLLERLESRLKVLTSGARDLPARQQTLRGAIDWSYDLLEPVERMLFARLAVFVGSWTLEGAEAVCNAGDDLTIDVIDGVQSLLDKSLIRHIAADDEPRFGMLETIREYALERLAARGEIGSLQQLHAGFYMVLAERAEQELVGPEQRVWQVRLEQEIGNLRAAMGQGDAESALRTSAALNRFWYTYGYLREGRKWIELLLARSAHLPQPVLAKALNVVGQIVYNLGELAQATQYLEESLARYRALGDKQNTGYLLLNLSGVARAQGDLRRSRTLSRLGLRVFRHLNHKPGIAGSLIRLGEQARMEGDYLTAHKYYEEGLALHRELGDRPGISGALLNLGHAVLRGGDVTQAAQWLREGINMKQSLGDLRGIATGVIGFARIALMQGRLEQAVKLFGAAEALYEAAGGSLFPADRADYNRDVATVRAALDETTIAVAWEQGRTLTPEQAITAALEAGCHPTPASSTM